MFQINRILFQNRILASEENNLILPEVGDKRFHSFQICANESLWDKLLRSKNEKQDKKTC